MPQGESRREAFHRLANHRTNAVLDRLRILGHLANRQLYEYDDEEVSKIFKAIETEARDVRAKFKNAKLSKFNL